jgi:hypothetical protein
LAIKLQLAQAQSGWIISAALEMRTGSLIAATIPWGCITADTVKMLEYHAWLQCVCRVAFVLWGDLTTGPAELKSVLTISGAPSVMMVGIILMQELSVGKWAFNNKDLLPLLLALRMLLPQLQSSTVMFDVEGEKGDSLTAQEVEITKAANISKMLV